MHDDAGAEIGRFEKPERLPRHRVESSWPAASCDGLDQEWLYSSTKPICVSDDPRPGLPKMRTSPLSPFSFETVPAISPFTR
jgi:hypothetical protein